MKLTVSTYSLLLWNNDVCTVSDTENIIIDYNRLLLLVVVVVIDSSLGGKQLVFGPVGVSWWGSPIGHIESITTGDTSERLSVFYEINSDIPSVINV